MKVAQIKARKVLNSAGQFTLEIETKYHNYTSFGSSPAGTSNSGAANKPLFKTLDETISQLNHRLPSMVAGRDFNDINDIIALEEEVKDLNLGVLPVLSISYSILDLISKETGIPKWKFLNKDKLRPNKVIPLNKVIGGGEHFKNGPAIQEFLVSNESKDILTNLEINKKVFDKAGKLLNEPGFDYEHGWTPTIKDNKAFEIMQKAISNVQQNYTEKIKMGVDVACNSIFQNGKYNGLTKEKYTSWLNSAIEKYDLFYIEDPYTEEDWSGFNELTSRFKNRLIVGDDILATNPVRLTKAHQREVCNSAIVKPNQVGSIGETLEFLNLVTKFKYTPIASHRSKETNDSTVADVALAYTPYIKMGIGGGERVEKLNQIIRISENGKR